MTEKYLFLRMTRSGKKLKKKRARIAANVRGVGETRHPPLFVTVYRRRVFVLRHIIIIIMRVDLHYYVINAKV